MPAAFIDRHPHPWSSDLGFVSDLRWTRDDCIGDAFPLYTEPPPVTLYTAEAEEVHRLLDVAGVPRTTDGQALSMAQRVAEATAMLRLANARQTSKDST